MVFCRCSARQNEHSITPIVLECMSGSPWRSSQMETEADGVSNTVRVTHMRDPADKKGTHMRAFFETLETLMLDSLIRTSATNCYSWRGSRWKAHRTAAYSKCPPLAAVSRTRRRLNSRSIPFLWVSHSAFMRSTSVMSFAMSSVFVQVRPILIVMWLQ